LTVSTEVVSKETPEVVEFNQMKARSTAEALTELVNEFGIVYVKLTPPPADYGPSNPDLPGSSGTGDRGFQSHMTETQKLTRQNAANRKFWNR